MEPSTTELRARMAAARPRPEALPPFPEGPDAAPEPDAWAQDDTLLAAAVIMVALALGILVGALLAAVL